VIVVNIYCDGEHCEDLGIVVSDPHTEVGGAGGVAVRGWAGPLPEGWIYLPSERPGRGVDLFCGACAERRN